MLEKLFFFLLLQKASIYGLILVLFIPCLFSLFLELSRMNNSKKKTTRRVFPFFVFANKISRKKRGKKRVFSLLPIVNAPITEHRKRKKKLLN
jgi:hypothetical protein